MRVTTAFVGCKVSQADGEGALAALTAAGLEPAGMRDEADVVVVHTCCVTAEAERKSRRLARRAAAGGRRVIVAGCAAALHPEQFEGENVVVAAQPDWSDIATRLSLREDELPSIAGNDDRAAGEAAGSGERGSGFCTAGGTASGTGSGAGFCTESRPQAQTTHSPGSTRPGSRSALPGGERTRLVLKVQDGCDGACTYCVVRLVRGRPRSVPLAEALETARRGIAEGCGEVVLSGIDLGAWRDGASRLPELLDAVAGLEGLRRVRLSSVEPRHVDDRLLDVMRHPCVARHLHVPLQSADDGVLRDMRRPYTYGEYLEAVAGLRSLPGGGMLSTDVIVGFPAEDEAAFERTLRALESGLFGRVHVFAFSARPGTAAAELPPLPAALVKERMGRALAAAQAAALAARRSALGRDAEVLVEERRDGLWRGYSSEYVRYALRGDARRGELVRAVADEVAGDGVRGTIKEWR